MVPALTLYGHFHYTSCICLALEQHTWFDSSYDLADDPICGFCASAAQSLPVLLHHCFGTSKLIAALTGIEGHLPSWPLLCRSLQVICTKVRDGDKRIVRLKEGQPRGRHVVIVDDLVQSGGTLLECQKLLRSQVRDHFLAWLGDSALGLPTVPLFSKSVTIC